ncbi:hypothetical protein [Cohnella silvisoli]|uniref:Uncharacterized protein n=1 Tax=Cohnella silvisoli TaxID=2873699 RepID=A0ABV1L3E0_9BACL|nr:hypothetical protein [Cohnella silvisoli]MCD9026136.1 hypothetical protein [Cohnella silvisoli]
MITRPISVRIRLIVPLAILLIVVASSFPLQAFATPTLKVQLPSKLERQVDEWVSRLAEQKPFAAWQTVDPQIEALGPGTHSWLVLFSKEGKDIGYMVVHAVTDGSFRLGEYGVGPYSLFSHQLLKHSLIDNGLISEDQTRLFTAVMHYVHPFAAAWEVKIGEETYWLDAKTAELLPVDHVTWSKKFPESKQTLYRGTKEGSSVDSLKLNELFDAYERLPWLTKEAPFPAKDAKKLQSRLNNKQHLRYVTEPFGDAMLYAVPVIGYQRWSNGRMDLAIDMEGTRFIPLSVLLGKGLFYR